MLSRIVPLMVLAAIEQSVYNEAVDVDVGVGELDSTVLLAKVKHELIKVVDPPATLVR